LSGEYWFRRRRGLLSWDLGWGWIPISIEGWLITGLFIAVAYVIFEKSLINKWIGLTTLILIFAFIADKKTQEPVLFRR